MDLNESDLVPIFLTEVGTKAQSKSEMYVCFKILKLKTVYK